MINRRGLALGGTAGLFLTATFVAVVAGTAGWPHLGQQVRADWWLLVPLVAGFTAQVTLMVELRRRHRLAHAASVSAGAGAGVSGAGMLACCAHHLVELAPLAGASGAATFLTDTQRPLMVAGIALNLVAVRVAVGKLRRTGASTTGALACAS